MITAMETLLAAWGEEVAAADYEVSIRSPLGADGLDSGGGTPGGHRVLSMVECHAVMTRAALVVQAALDGMAADEPAGLGSLGRVLVNLARLRYCQRPGLALAEQCRALGISVRTYRTRVDDLHLALRGALPLVAAARAKAELELPSSVAARVRLERARVASRSEARRDRRRREQLREADRVRAERALADE